MRLRQDRNHLLPPRCPLVDAGELVTYPPPPPAPVFASAACSGICRRWSASSISSQAFPPPAKGVVPGPPPPVPPSGDGLGSVNRCTAATSNPKLARRYHSPFGVGAEVGPSTPPNAVADSGFLNVDGI